MAGAKTVNVGVLLPLHDNDGDGRRMVEYYRGLLLACDRVKKDGITVDMHAWNVPIDADINQTLKEKDVDKCDIIIGPLYTKMVKPLADFCAAVACNTEYIESGDLHWVSLDSNIHYLAPATGEFLRATCQPLKLGRSTSLFQTIIESPDNGKNIAIVETTMIQV